jgi:hypothetical protein
LLWCSIGPAAGVADLFGGWNYDRSQSGQVFVWLSDCPSMDTVQSAEVAARFMNFSDLRIFGSWHDGCMQRQQERRRNAMKNWKYRLAAALLCVYATIALGAVGNEAFRFAKCSGLFSGGADATVRASSGEGGGDSWQAFLPGMLK